MKADFWRRKWRDDQLGWHQPKPHPMLVRHLPALGLADGARVFVPLCGKTLDIGWLLAEGFSVAGAELVEDAIVQLFAGLGVTSEIAPAGGLKRYSADGIDVFVGDLFDLDAATLGPVDAVYDRAALVALPAATRPRYAAHLGAITAHAPRLLITFDYDPGLMAGPPFSIPNSEVEALHAAAYDVALLESAEVEGGLKGRCPSLKKAWSLRPRS